MKKRLFIAIDFPPEVKKQIGQLINKLKKKYPEIRWEKEENLHLTLKFLGWVPFDFAQGEKLGEILKGMERAVVGIKPFWFKPTKIGYFLRESLIVWLGLESQEGLLKLVDNLEREMERIGFPREKRPFASHVTLGRKRHAHPVFQWHQIAQDLENFPTPQFDPAESGMKVEKIVLMESHLSPAGSTYVPLAVQGLIF